MFLASGENGPESVFEIQYSNNSPYYNWGAVNRGQGNYSIQQNGVRGLSGTAAMPYAPGWSTNLPTQNLAAAYQAGDQRKDATLFDVEAYKNANPQLNVTYQVAPFKNTGLYNHKYLPRKGETSGQVELNYLNNFRTIRYAEVLLLAAEAFNRSSTPNDTKARGYLNQVRQRAFGNTSQNSTASGTALRQAIWDERRLELAMEGDRFFDLVRTGQAVGRIPGFTPGKHEVFPIPQQEIIMKNIRHLFTLLLLIGTLAGCKKELFDDTSFATSGEAPATLNALFEITQDNTGMVTITPNGNGAAYYDVYFGDGTTTPARVDAGKNVTKKYAEGVYNVRLVGYGVNGKTTEATKQLTVSFRAPEKLDFTITKDLTNNYKIQVTASALYETAFRVYFGDVTNEVPVTFNEGDVVNKTYTATGTYTVRVVALSGGAATTELTKTVAIVDPVLLPITFETTSTVFNWIGFDGGNVTVINNPQKVGDNTSNRVGRMVKSAGQPWGGALITLGAPINFSANKIFRMKVFSPRVGAKVLLKVENPSNNAQAFEKEVSTTIANAWEDLVFDFSAINTANTYQNVVLIFDLGTMGDGSANFTFLFDDIRLTNTLPSSQLSLIVVFALEIILK